MSGEITISGPDNEKLIEWKLFHVCKRFDSIFKSPAFYIFNYKFYLKLDFEDNENMWMQLISYSKCDMRIDYIMGIKNADGSEIRTKKAELMLLNMGNTPSHKLVSRNKLLNSENSIGDCLTVFCNIHLIEIIYSDMNTFISNPLLHDTDGENTMDILFSNVSSVEEKVLDIATSKDSSPGEAVLVQIENYKDLFLKKTCTDVTIKVKNKEFPVHKIVLVARSEIFASMFQPGCTEETCNIVEIPDCDPESFEDFLLFLYTTDVKIVSSRNAANLYKTSRRYGCKELLKECVQCMIQKLSVETFCDYCYLASVFNESDLLTASTNFFIKNAKHIFPTIKWLTLLQEHPLLCQQLLIKFSNSG